MGVRRTAIYEQTLTVDSGYWVELNWPELGVALAKLDHSGASQTKNVKLPCDARLLSLRVQLNCLVFSGS